MVSGDDDQTMMTEKVKMLLDSIAQNGSDTICIGGTFVRRTGYIHIEVIRNDTYIYGMGAFISNSTLLLTSNRSLLSKIIFDNINIEHTTIQLSDVNLIFVNCSFIGVRILDKVLANSTVISHVQIGIYSSMFHCFNDTNEAAGCGNVISLTAMSIVKLLIIESRFQYVRVGISARGLKIDVIKCSVIDTSLKVKIRSYIRIPTIINFQETTFMHTRNSLSLQVMILDLYNPYVTISNCSFSSIALDIVAKDHHYQQDLFYVQVVHSLFKVAVKQGNGGALSLTSDDVQAKVCLYEIVFRNNTLMKASGSDSGRGGALFVQGNALNLSITDCVFLNNSAEGEGSAVFLSEGVTATITNTSFEVDIIEQIIVPIITSFGKIETLQSDIKVHNRFPNHITRNIDVLSVSHVLTSMLVSVECPPWYTHLPEYKSVPNAAMSMKNVSTWMLRDVLYQCGVCSEKYHTVSNRKNIISFGDGHNELLQTSYPERSCTPCPYGAVCSGNNVIPLPNFWGYWHEGKLLFKQCPAGYCCTGRGKAPCDVFNACAGNRTGTLCGVCQKGFSVSILSGACTPDSLCGEDQWFWIFVLLATFGYAFWYTCKDKIFEVMVDLVKRSKPMCSRKKDCKDLVLNQIPNKESVLPRVEEASDENDTSNNSVQNDFTLWTEKMNMNDLDKGYIGIITYYVQTAAIIKIQIEFRETENNNSLVDVILSKIETFLNFELSYLSYDVCPIVGLTKLGKLVYKIVLLFGIYISWTAVFLCTYIILVVMQKMEKKQSSGWLGSFKLQLISGLIEIIKYTYSGFCNIIFMSLACVEIGKTLVWWYDATHQCLENWQVLIVAFAFFYAVPFPFALLFGMRLLKRAEISAFNFICCCLFPLSIFHFSFKCKATKRDTKETDLEELSKASKLIISVLQGPYREDNKHMTLYWEAMVSMRRLLISAMTLVDFSSIRMVIITVLCIAFLYQHVKLSPFQVRSSNHVEGLSLFLLSIASVINLLKATVTDSGNLPSGPSLKFFQGLEVTEKTFIFVIVFFIAMTELKLRMVRHSP